MSLQRIAPLMLEHGYGRDMSAQPTDIWYVHPKGHMIRAVPMPESAEGFWWEYFPPELIGDRQRGHGFDRLQSHLASVHAKADRFKPLWQEETAPLEERSPNPVSAIDFADRDFFIVQTSVAPIERYEVRESGSLYPRLISFHPKTGQWRDYSADANEETGDQRYIEVVRRWIQLGKPVVKRKDAGPQPRANGPSDSYGGYETGRSNRGMDGNTAFPAGMGTPVYSVPTGTRG